MNTLLRSVLRYAVYGLLRGRSRVVLALLGVGALVLLIAANGARAGELAYAEYTSPVTIGATVEGSPTDVVSAGSVTYAAEKLRVEFYSPGINNLGSYVICNLWEDSTNLGRIALVSTSNAVPVTAVRYRTPSAGAHTYKIGCWQAGNASSVVNGSTGGAGNLPGYLRVSNESSGSGSVAWADVTSKPTFSLDWLSDVDTTGVLDGTIIKYDSASSTWIIATDDTGSAGGTVSLSTPDRDRLDLVWYGIWAIAGFLLVLILAPRWFAAFRITHGL